MINTRRIAAWAIAGIMFPSICMAQIKIGQTAGFTGPAAASVKELTDGAKLYIDSVNADGGINGQTIELVSMDDKFDPALAAENAKTLIADPKVVALFLSRGTPHSLAILPILSANRIALVAPSTGAMALHSPVHPWVFNVRATYRREADLVTRQLMQTTNKRVAIIQVNDSFGNDAAAGSLKVFTELGIQPVAHQIYDRTNPTFSELVPKVIAAQPQAILFIGASAAMVDAVIALRHAGSRASIATLSHNASSGFIKEMGENAKGIIVSQVFPSVRSMKVPMALEASRLAKTHGIPEVTPQMFEGFAAAKVMVLAMKRAGKDITRTSIKAALEGFSHVDIGGLEVSYSATDHTGLDYADVSIVAADGSFKR